MGAGLRIARESYTIASVDRTEVMRYLGYDGQAVSSELNARMNELVARCIALYEERPDRVAGQTGTGASPLSEEECAEIYEEQIGAGVSAGADCIQLETFMDVKMMKIAAEIAKFKAAADGIALK